MYQSCRYDRNPNVRALDPAVEALIVAMARRACSSPPFGPHDQPDIEQDLREAWLRARHRHDPAHGGLCAFARVVCDRALRDRVKHRRAAKRGAPTISLEHAVGPDGSTALDVATVGQFAPGWPGEQRDPESALMVRVEARLLLARLTEEEQATCAEVTAHGVSQASRNLGIPPSTLHSRMRRIGRR